ncbi:glycerate kinase [Acetobacter nitrogenifigens DSM 23921 = NBRC 105050]|uniref:Glycerate kinase n=1 Tax=Acetobacter nitrogenifigens DSM 23921 = NBRC 105050 TaxID=1120919 RepID=A0A511X6L9_9PROT|nr:glycerate kinase [Acetobacter nitrogenifigens]GBQ98997.1 glycerate kinase [Acetobacter nitrogenifigens DSM 23921 = NBRC 105050]GEN58580.1 glycerate kinase [Acetobacter nitrogenifigens DSM 23921 = NBRC 105050]
MKIAIICDSFKESLSALEVADEIEAGFRLVWPDVVCVKLPAADGGEGTVAALVAATGGRVVRTCVTGPLGDPVEGFFGVTGDGRTAIIEMAAAAGLELLSPERRDPLRATTRGVGELFCAALDAGCRHIILGLGGSATNDGGAGFAQALGASLLDDSGREIEAGGAALTRLARISLDELDPRLAETRVDVACDVDNPLTGEHGASAVFGPQKGATQAMVDVLDAALSHYAGRITADLGRDVASVPGAGAAGGMGAAALAFLDARMRPGVEIVMEALGVAEIVADVDLVITGEGRIDGQTVRGKTPAGVARVARQAGKPVIAIAGSLGAGVDDVYGAGIDAVFSTMQRPGSLSEALAEARSSLRRTARNVAMAIRLGSGLGA